MARLLTCVAILLCSSVAKAAPDTIVQYLMNDRPSMLDLGILRMQGALEGIRVPNGAEIYSSVTYDFEKNRIDIASTLLKSSQPEQDCIAAIDGIRLNMLVNPRSGKPASGGTSTAGAFFEHVGYRLKNAPKGIEKDIDAITEIAVVVYHNGGVTKCKGSLVGKNHYFLKKK